MNKMKTSLALLLVLGSLTAAVGADETLATFSGGIGVIPVSSAPGTNPTATTVNRNIVRGVQPAGQLWVIRKLEAEVKTSGGITVIGEGLVFGGGDNVGRATGQRVFATLICAAGEAFVQHNSAAVPLDANGNFTIDDELAPAPANCDSPALLIRNAAGSQGWFAAGIPRMP